MKKMVLLFPLYENILTSNLIKLYSQHRNLFTWNSVYDVKHIKRIMKLFFKFNLSQYIAGSLFLEFRQCGYDIANFDGSLFEFIRKQSKRGYHKVYVQLLLSKNIPEYFTNLIAQKSEW